MGFLKKQIVAGVRPQQWDEKFDSYAKGGNISRRDALNVLRTTGSTNKESRQEHRNEKLKARESGLKGNQMIDVARANTMARGIERILPALGEVVIEENPIAYEDVFANLEVPTSLGVKIMEKQPVTPNDVIGGNFKEAFRAARKRGLNTFVWDNKNAKYDRYNTELKKPEPKKSAEFVTSETPSYPVYIPEDKNSLKENLKAAIINNAIYMK